jgi:hypothetical protein
VGIPGWGVIEFLGLSGRVNLRGNLTNRDYFVYSFGTNSYLIASMNFSQNPSVIRFLVGVKITNSIKTYLPLAGFASGVRRFIAAPNSRLNKQRPIKLIKLIKTVLKISNPDGTGELEI